MKNLSTQHFIAQTCKLQTALEKLNAHSINVLDVCFDSLTIRIQPPQPATPIRGLGVALMSTSQGDLTNYVSLLDGCKVIWQDMAKPRVTL